MLQAETQWRPTARKFQPKMPQAATMERGLGKQSGCETSQSYRPELRDTARGLRREARTTIREWLGHPVSLVLCKNLKSQISNHCFITGVSPASVSSAIAREASRAGDCPAGCRVSRKATRAVVSAGLRFLP